MAEKSCVKRLQKEYRALCKVCIVVFTNCICCNLFMVFTSISGAQFSTFQMVHYFNCLNKYISLRIWDFNIVSDITILAYMMDDIVLFSMLQCFCLICSRACASVFSGFSPFLICFVLSYSWYYIFQLVKIHFIGFVYKSKGRRIISLILQVTRLDNM